MLPTSKQPQSNHFNDYIIAHQAPPYKLLSSQDRSMSSNSIYYQQNSLSRKKLTVISRDNSKPDFRGDYLLGQNVSSLSSTNRTKIQNFLHSPMRNTQSNHTFSQRNSQATQSLANSRVQRGKLKRPMSPSPSPMTPTKVLKLKKSMVSENNQQSASNMSAQRSVNNSISRRKFESQVTSPMKVVIEGHRRLASNTNDVQSYSGNNGQNTFFGGLQNVRRELTSIFNLKVLEFQSRLQHQDETIKSLENKLNENHRKLKEKDRLIEQLSCNRQRSKTFTIHPSNGHKNSPSVGNEPYLMKRIKDIESKCNIFSNEQNRLQKNQQSIQNLMSVLQTQLISFNSSKLNQLKINLSKFLQQKSASLSYLAQSVSYLDNKLIGRTQAIKQMLCELKQKVREVQDSWTHKDTKETKQSTTIGLKQDVQEFGHVNKNYAMRRVQNRLKQITSQDNIKQSKSKNQQGSLQFSLTSYDEQTLRTKHIKNVYYDENFNQMEDVSIGMLQNGTRDDSSRLTDDFYYPGSTNNTSRHTSRNISPINSRKQGNEYYGNSKESKSSTTNFKKKQSPSSAKTPINCFKTQLQQQQSPPSPQSAIRISNQQINKKIQCIQQLIQSKKTSSCQQIQRGQLRCYVDKTGYLKYTDSKTFVFDKKGNLIPCTDGEFWFLVTKGLIYGKRDEEQSRTMSFIEYDQ